MTTPEILGQTGDTDPISDYQRQVELLQTRKQAAEASIYGELQKRLQKVADLITQASKMGLTLDLHRPEFFQPLTEAKLRVASDGEGHVDREAPRRQRAVYQERGAAKPTFISVIESSAPIGGTFERTPTVAKHGQKALHWFNRFVPELIEEGVIERVSAGVYKRLK